MMLNRIKIIKKLLETGTVDRMTLSRVMSICRGNRAIVLQALANHAGMTSSQIRDFFEEHFGLQNIELNDFLLDPGVVKLVPFEVAWNHLIVPAFRISDKTFLAVSNPLNIEGLEEICEYIGSRCEILLSPEEQVKKAIEDSIRPEGKKSTRSNSLR